MRITRIFNTLFSSKFCRLNRIVRPRPKDSATSRTHGSRSAHVSAMSLEPRALMTTLPTVAIERAALVHRIRARSAPTVSYADATPDAANDTAGAFDAGRPEPAARLTARALPVAQSVRRVKRATAPSVARSIAPAAVWSAVPLDEMTGTYKGYEGGLYGAGRNQPVGKLKEAVEQATLRIVPRDSAGRPAANGRIGLVAIGQSTTRMVFEPFQRQAGRVKARSVTLVNAALDGMVSSNWASSGGLWSTTLSRVRRAGLSPQQVQAVWVEVALLNPDRYGAFPAHNRTYARHLESIVNNAASLFPNLQVVYLSSRYYAGYTSRRTSFEPYAYESAFGIRDLILSRVPETGGINPARRPVVLWGPYYWTDGARPSQVDGLSMNRNDLASDGVHPSRSGSQKIGNQLMRFFASDPLASRWFLAGRSSS